MKYLSISTLIFIFITYTACQDKIQTLELQYIPWSYEGGNWATTDDISKYHDTASLAEHSIFLEPADQTLILPDTLGYSDDIVQFTGQFYTEKSIQKNDAKNGQVVGKAKVFRYTSFKVIKSNYRGIINL